MKSLPFMFFAVFAAVSSQVFAVLPEDGTYTGKATISFAPNVSGMTKPVVLKRTEKVTAVVMPSSADPYDRLLLVMAPQDSTLFEYFSNPNFPNSKFVAAIRFNSISAAAAIDFIISNELTSTLSGSTQAVAVTFENDNTAMQVRGQIIGGHQTLQISLKRAAK